jgi:NAD(P)H-hydrate repair Nnr-like enzyme with NAD(P)H-hydrate epimerase domain
MISNLNKTKIKYISAKLAKELDDLLMGPEVGYVTEQLMEIAGQSVALCVDNYAKAEKVKSKILTICGPGSK